MVDGVAAELEDAIALGYAARDRDDMAPTVAYFHALLDRHPGNPVVLYEVGGAHDTAGDEEPACRYYERALRAGLSGDHRRRCLLQYGSTLRNLSRHEESISTLAQARTEFPDSDSVRLFLALSLHAGGRSDAAIAELLELATDRLRSPDVARYEVALRGYAGLLAEQDHRRLSPS